MLRAKRVARYVLHVAPAFTCRSARELSTPLLLDALIELAGLQAGEASSREAPHLDKEVEQRCAAFEEGKDRRPRYRQRRKRQVHARAEDRQEHLETVPLPSTVEDVNDASMAGFFASGAFTPTAGGLVMEAVPLTSQPTHRAGRSGWRLVARLPLKLRITTCSTSRTRGCRPPGLSMHVLRAHTGGGCSLYFFAVHDR